MYMQLRFTIDWLEFYVHIHVFVYPGIFNLDLTVNY